MTYFSYPLDPADVDSLKSIGLDAPVVSASSKQLNAAQKMPDNRPCPHDAVAFLGAL